MSSGWRDGGAAADATGDREEGTSAAPRCAGAGAASSPAARAVSPPRLATSASSATTGHPRSHRSSPPRASPSNSGSSPCRPPAASSSSTAAATASCCARSAPGSRRSSGSWSATRWTGPSRACRPSPSTGTRCPAALSFRGKEPSSVVVVLFGVTSPNFHVLVYSSASSAWEAATGALKRPLVPHQGPSVVYRLECEDKYIMDVNTTRMTLSALLLPNAGMMVYRGNNWIGKTEDGRLCFFAIREEEAASSEIGSDIT